MIFIFVYWHRNGSMHWAVRYLLHFNMEIACVYAIKFGNFSNIKIKIECLVDDHVFHRMLHNRFRVFHKLMLLPCKRIVYLLVSHISIGIHFLIFHFLCTCNHDKSIDDYPISKLHTLQLYLKRRNQSKKISNDVVWTFFLVSRFFHFVYFWLKTWKKWTFKSVYWFLFLFINAFMHLNQYAYAIKLDSLSSIKINYECSVDDHVFV